MANKNESSRIRHTVHPHVFFECVDYVAQRIATTEETSVVLGLYMDDFGVNQELAEHQTSCRTVPPTIVTICVMEGLKHLKVHTTDVAGVWDVTLPLLLNHQAAKRERDSIVTTILGKFPFLALYSSLDCPAERELWWSFPTATDILNTLGSLYEGGWALFFFDHNPVGLAATIDVVPTDGNGILKLCDLIGSRAAIVSWFDDREWIVADQTDSK